MSTCKKGNSEYSGQASRTEQADMAQISSLTGRCASLHSTRVAARPSRRSGRIACSALPPSPPGITFGCHAQVWCGDWQKADIEKAVQGSKKAGFDLVEGEPHTTS